MTYSVSGESVISWAMVMVVVVEPVISSSAHLAQVGLQSWVVQVAVPPVADRSQPVRWSVKEPSLSQLAQAEWLGEGAAETDDAEEAEETEETEEGEADGADEMDEAEETDEAEDTDEAGLLGLQLAARTPSTARRPTARTLKRPFIIELSSIERGQKE